jgi:hypothetical protein
MNGIAGDGVFENGQHKLTKPDRRCNKYKNKSPQTLVEGTEKVPLFFKVEKSQ